MLESSRWRIIILGESAGYGAKYIQKVVKKYDGEDMSTATIYKVLSDAGVSLMDYRRGETNIARRRVIELDCGKKERRKPMGHTAWDHGKKNPKPKTKRKKNTQRRRKAA